MRIPATVSYRLGEFSLYFCLYELMLSFGGGGSIETTDNIWNQITQNIVNVTTNKYHLVGESTFIMTLYLFCRMGA